MFRDSELEPFFWLPPLSSPFLFEPFLNIQNTMPYMYCVPIVNFFRIILEWIWKMLYPKQFVSQK